MQPSPVRRPTLRLRSRALLRTTALILCVGALAASTDDLRAHPSAQAGTSQSETTVQDGLVPLVEVDVVQPGPIELALPAALTPWVRDGRLIIVDTDGHLRWARVDRSAGRPRSWLTGQVVDVVESDEALSIVIDVGEKALAGHDRLRIELREPATVSSLRLEASEDSASWRPVSTGVLFSAGEDASMRLSELSYPTTNHRFLRLIWPPGAPRPSWRSLLVHRAPTALAEAQQLAILPADSNAIDSRLSDSRREWQVSTPASRSGSGLLNLSWQPGTTPAGLRVFTAIDGSWRPVTMGQAKGGLSIDLTGGDGDAGTLRIDLSTADGPSAELTRVLFSDTAPRLRWKASKPGRYVVAASVDPPETLLLGAEPADSLSAGARPSASRVVAPAHLVLPSSLHPPGAVAPDGEIAERWEIQVAADVAAGTLIGSSLPDTALPPDGSDASRLRLLQDGRQLPFVFDRNLPPRKIAALRASPSVTTNPAGAAESARNTSHLVLDLPTDRGVPTLLELYSAEGPFERHVTVSVDDPNAPVGAQSQRVLGRFDWRCPTPQALHCRQSLSLQRFRPSTRERHLRLTFADDANPPLGNVEVQLWARDARLIFVAPADPGPLSLVAFEEPLREPRYDLEPLLQRWASLADHDATTTTAGFAESGEGTETSREMPPWLLTAALAAATVILLWVLVRTIGSERPEPEASS